ncbi:MAG: hypothetical protein H7Y17_12130 [Chlorobia bacterium]|nr:hypothetical protein [Fimbriimonadaceae bacterium]
MKMGLKVPVALAFMMVACYAKASITALTFIPVADILGHREVVVGYLAFGNEKKIDKKIYHYAYTCVGIGDVVEVAYGDDLEKGQTTHFKLKLLEGDNYMLSAGASNYEGHGVMADYFVAGRYDLHNLRLHFGYLKNDEHRAFFGADFPVFGTCTASLEWMSGPGAYGWASLNIPVKQLPGFNIWLGAGIPSDRESQGYQYTVGFWYGFKL